MEQLKIDSTMDTRQEAVPPEYDLDTLINGINGVTPDPAQNAERKKARNPGCAPHAARPWPAAITTPLEIQAPRRLRWRY